MRLSLRTRPVPQTLEASSPAALQTEPDLCTAPWPPTLFFEEETEPFGASLRPAGVSAVSKSSASSLTACPGDTGASGSCRRGELEAGGTQAATLTCGDTLAAKAAPASGERRTLMAVEDAWAGALGQGVATEGETKGEQPAGAGEAGAHSPRDTEEPKGCALVTLSFDAPFGAGASAGEPMASPSNCVCCRGCVMATPVRRGGVDLRAGGLCGGSKLSFDSSTPVGDAEAQHSGRVSSPGAERRGGVHFRTGR